MIGIARLTRRGLTAALLVIGIDFAAMPVRAQLAPSQPIKIVVGVPAGGLGDLAGRILAQRLSENGHPAIVENRLGGNGIIATDAVAKSRADGYTLIMANHSTLAILPHITKIGYDPEKDLAPIALMLAAPNVAIVKSALPVTSMGDLVAYGKINRLTNATQGIGASGHLIGEQFKQLTGVDLVHVHYRGAALQGGAWFGLMAPAGTPRATVDWLNAETRKAFEVPEVRERLSKQGLQLPLGSPEEFAALIAAESKRWGEVIRTGGIKLESN